MRTNIDIDDEKVSRIMKIAGVKTKKDAIRIAVDKYLRLHDQRKAFDSLRGIGWEGDLDEMRNNWSSKTDWGLHEK